MMTRYDAQLNMKSLSAVDPAIYITDISYQQPQEETKTAALANRPGTLMMHKLRRSLSVIITFEIHEPDTKRRQQVLRHVQEWARDGGILTTSDRTGQQLRVKRERLPVITSALKWTEKLQIVLTAYAQPYWEDVREVSLGITGTDVFGDAYIPGLAPYTLVSVTVRNMSAENVDTITLRAGDTFMEFTDLGLEPEKVLVIEYDERMIQTIRVGTLSRAKRRTPESSDDLLLRCGETGRMSVTADHEVRATFHTRGLWE